MIKDCIWKGRRLSCSAIFSKQPTDRGMCCSFNKETADKMFKESLYKEQIEKLTHQDKTLSAEDSAVPDWQVLLWIMLSYIAKQLFNYVSLSYIC